MYKPRKSESIPGFLAGLTFHIESTRMSPDSLKTIMSFLLYPKYLRYWIRSVILVETVRYPSVLSQKPTHTRRWLIVRKGAEKAHRKIEQQDPKSKNRARSPSISVWQPRTAPQGVRRRVCYQHRHLQTPTYSSRCLELKQHYIHPQHQETTALVMILAVDPVRNGDVMRERREKCFRSLKSQGYDMTSKSSPS